MLRNTGKREAEILVYLAKQGVRPTDLDRMVINTMENEIHQLWEKHTIGNNLEKIDLLQKELDAIRQGTTKAEGRA